MQQSSDPDRGPVSHHRRGLVPSGPGVRSGRPSGRHRLLPAMLALAAIPLAISQVYADEVTATWIGSSGDYGTGSDWDIGVVPLNNATETFIVDIGSNVTVDYSVAGAQSIDALSLGSKSFFDLSSSSSTNPSVLTVLGAATLGGSINANGASFIAQGAGTSFVGNTSTVSAAGGGLVSIAATSFDVSGTIANVNVLSASGTGSKIDLHTVQTLNAAVRSIT